MPENANHSPRISFSQDFPNSDSIPIEQSPLRSPSESSSHYSSFNFDFSVPGGVISGENSFYAEEFFYDGKILPTEIKKRSETGFPKPETNPIGDVKPVMEIEVMAMETKPRPLSFLLSSEPGGTKEETNPIRNVKPVHEIEMAMEEELSTEAILWLNRIDSQDCEIGLPFLANSKQTIKLQVSYSSSSSSSSSSFQKPPLKKKKMNYGGEIKVNSFLDVFPSGSLFGFELINFGSGSDKNKTRSSICFDW